MGQYVGIDLHRRSTTIVRMAEDGEVLGTRFVSQPFELAQAMAAAGPRGGARIHLWLVLGGRSSSGARRPRAPGPCARQQLGEPTRPE